MRAIIIDDKDARALIDQLTLASMDSRNLGGYNVGESEAWFTLSENTRRAIVDVLHRRFHYVVTRWLQDQGASTT